VRLLLVTYEFPPRGGPGVQRPVKLVKYLEPLGWDVTVLTVKNPVTAIVDATLLNELPESTQVLRAWSLEPMRLVSLFRRLRPTRARGANTRGSASGGASPALIKRIQSWFVPDEKRFWKPWAVRAALRAARVTPFDAVLSTGPPHTAHLIGSTVAERLSLPHVVDFRDPWIGYFNYRAATEFHSLLNERAERTVLEHAAVATVVTPSMLEILESRYPKRQFRTALITNGFDPADLPETREPDPEHCRFVHTGVFTPPRSPEPFLHGLARAEESNPSLAQRLRVDFVGAGIEVEEMARSYGILSAVRGLGYMDHAASIKRLARADVALVLLSPGRESEVSLTGKVFEYMGMRLPILAAVGTGAVANFLADKDYAVVADSDHPDEIAGAINEYVRQWSAGELTGPGPEDVRPFSREFQAAQFAALLDEFARKD